MFTSCLELHNLNLMTYFHLQVEIRCLWLLRTQEIKVNGHAQAGY